MVPLWWDGGTLDDLRAWKATRQELGATAPFVAPLHDEKPFSRHTLRKRYRTSCRILGPERLETLTIHHGRHTFISHALAGGRTLAEVRDAAGHANVSITSAYLHVAVEDGRWELCSACQRSTRGNLVPVTSCKCFCLAIGSCVTDPKSLSFSEGISYED
jgi:hypothetical protein